MEPFSFLVQFWWSVFISFIFEINNHSAKLAHIFFMDKFIFHRQGYLFWERVCLLWEIELFSLEDGAIYFEKQGYLLQETGLFALV